ncbi:MAG: iron-sulfur cluster-binding domain-containing protein [Pseudomonadota bacterium]
MLSSFRSLFAGTPMQRNNEPRAALKAGAPKEPDYWQGTLTIAEIIQETDEIKTFRLIAPDAPMPFDFLPGQYVDLELDINGKRLHRSYSISSSAFEKRYIDLTIKRERHGLASRFLCDRAKVGDTLKARGPFGQFVFTGDKAREVIVAGAGVGVTPLVSMIRSLRDKQWEGEVFALFGFRRESDSLFLGELNDLNAGSKNFHLKLTWSQPEHSETASRGRVDAASLLNFASKPKSTAIFICGPNAMMDQMCDELTDAGVPERNLYFEAFAPPPKDLSKGGVFDIIFQPSGVTATSEPGENVLETAERAGVEFDYSCRNGTCGLCQATLTAGEVELVIDDALEEEDIENGVILTCQSFPRKNCAISL